MSSACKSVTTAAAGATRGWQPIFETAWLKAEGAGICARCGSNLLRGRRDSVAGRLGILFMVICDACDARMQLERGARKEFIAAARWKMEHLAAKARRGHRPRHPARWPA